MTPVDENAIQVHGIGRDQPELTAEQMQQGIAAIARAYARGRKEHLEHCWLKGQTAKEQGFVRVTPYYEDPGADIFWFCGYDGLTLQEAAVLHDAAYEQGQKGKTA